jgi:hypothetical protein
VSGPGAPPPDRRARLGAAALLLVAFALLARAALRDPGLTHGDNFSDANVVIAGRNFDARGLGFQGGLPTQYTYFAPDRKVSPYTHYPPGPEWMHQAWKGLGLRTPRQWRLASLGVAFVAMVLAFLVFRQLGASELTATVALCFFVWSPPFLGYADSYHQFPYRFLTLFAFVAAWLRHEAADAPATRRLWLGAGAALLFVDGWFSFEHLLLVPLFALGRALLARRRELLVSAVLIGMVPAVVVASRLAHNAIALGDWEAAYADILDVARVRSRGELEGSYGVLVRQWIGRLGYGVPDGDFDREFEFPILAPAVGLPALVLGLALLHRGRTSDEAIRAPLRNGLLLLGAGLGWFVAMKGHAIPHRHVVLLLLPGLALLLAGLLSWSLRSGPRWTVLVSAALAVGYLLEIHRTPPLNRLVALYRPGIARYRDTQQADERRKTFGAQALRGLRDVVFHHRYPEEAAALVTPFEYFDDREWARIAAGGDPQPVPGNLTPEEGLWIEAWSDEEKVATLKALELYGFPDMLAPGEAVSIVFYGRPPPRLVPCVSFDGRFVLTGLRLTNSLDRRTVIVQAELRGKLRDPAAENLTLHVEVQDSRGNGKLGDDVLVRDQVRGEDQAFVWAAFPVTAVPRAARIGVALRDGTRGLPLSAGGEALPPSLDLREAEGLLVWKPEVP